MVTPHGVKRAYEIISLEQAVGFDTESRPSFKKGENHPPALIQIATPAQTFIFRLRFLEFNKDIIHLLENESILKVGVGIHDDLIRLKMLGQFKEKGFLDIAKMAHKQGCEEASLRALTAIYLGHRLSKGAKLENWAKEDLSEKQLKYAALDAVAGLQIYEKLLGP